MQVLEQRLLAAELRLAGVREIHTARYMQDRSGATVATCRACLGAEWPCLTWLVVDAPFGELREALAGLGIESPPPAP